MVDVNKIELIIAKLTAMSDFSLEVKTFMDEMLAEAEKAEKNAIESLPLTPEQEKKATKEVKKEEVAEEKQEEEPEVTIDSIIEEFGLGEYTEDELKGELKNAGVKFGVRAKKDKLMELTAQAIIDGKISTGDEEDEEPVQEEPEESKKEPTEVVEPEKEETAEEKADEDEEVTEEDIRGMSEEELTNICKENEIEIPEEVSKLKFKAKRVKALQEFLIEMLSDDEDEEEPVVEETKEETVEEFPASQERLDAEEEVEKDVREKIAKKKLTISAIKKELKNYYDGKAECKDCKGCTEEEIIECYILLRKAFVDDDGELHEAEDPYERNEKYFCCGKELVEDPDEKDTMVCEVCASKYEV